MLFKKRKISISNEDLDESDVRRCEKYETVKEIWNKCLIRNLKVSGQKG